MFKTRGEEGRREGLFKCKNTQITINYTKSLNLFKDTSIGLQVLLRRGKNLTSSHRRLSRRTWLQVFFNVFKYPPQYK